MGIGWLRLPAVQTIQPVSFCLCIIYIYKNDIDPLYMYSSNSLKGSKQFMKKEHVGGWQYIIYTILYYILYRSMVCFSDPNEHYVLLEILVAFPIVMPAATELHNPACINCIVYCIVRSRMFSREICVAFLGKASCIRVMQCHPANRVNA